MVGDSHVDADYNHCFCGTVGSMKGVVPVVSNVPCHVPYFLMSFFDE